MKKLGHKKKAENKRKSRDKKKLEQRKTEEKKNLAEDQSWLEEELENLMGRIHVTGSEWDSLAATCIRVIFLFLSIILFL